MKKKLFLTIFVLLMMIIPFNINASSKYDITGDNVVVKVDEHGILTVTEDVLIDFNKKTDYVYKYIPLEYGKVYNTECNINFSKSKSNNNLVLKIGDEKNKFAGRKKITIKYVYKLKDISKFNFNITNNKFDYPMNNVNFTIEMPKKINREDISFSGYNTDNITYGLSDNKIFGGLVRGLNKDKSVNISIKLKDGYFTENSVDYADKIIVIVLMLFLLTILGIGYFLKGKK